MTTGFCNRTEAGRLLAKKLTVYAKCPNVIVLALPRGGTPVAFEIANTLNLPLDICLVRKLGLPGNAELAIGAVAIGGVRVLNQDIIAEFGVSDDAIERVTAKEQRELERRDRLYRQSRPPSNLRNQTLIIVDDGIATGSTLHAAILALKQQNPARIVVAIPVAPLATYTALKSEVDEFVCLKTPVSLYSISLWYKDFSQISDQEVRDLLQWSDIKRLPGQHSLVVTE